jgi:hypothetical protein
MQHQQAGWPSRIKLYYAQYFISNDMHRWPFIHQTDMLKRITRSWCTFQNPAAGFTCLSNCHYQNQYRSERASDWTNTATLSPSYPLQPSSHLLSNVLVFISRLNKCLFLQHAHTHTHTHTHAMISLTQWTCPKPATLPTWSCDPGDWVQCFGAATQHAANTRRRKYLFALCHRQTAQMSTQGRGSLKETSLSVRSDDLFQTLVYWGYLEQLQGWPEWLSFDTQPANEELRPFCPQQATSRPNSLISKHASTHSLPKWFLPVTNLQLTISYIPHLFKFNFPNFPSL